MRAADWKRLSKPILTETDADWGWARALAYIRPTSWIVHGVLAEDSANRKGSFYLWVVGIPLMVPLGGVVNLSWSDRFGGASTTYTPDSSRATSAISGAAWAAIANEQDGGLLLAPPGGADNVRMQEARAYGLLLSGNDAGALEVLRRVERNEATYPWVSELLERAAAMAALIETDQRDEVVRQLRSWRTENCESLKLAYERGE